MNTQLGKSLLFTFLIGLAACAAPDESVDVGANALGEAHAPARSEILPVQLSERNCELETFVAYDGTGEVPPLYCYPNGELLTRSSFLKSSKPGKYTIRRTMHEGRIALAIRDDSRPFTQTLAAFNGLQRVGDPFFHVVEERGVVAIQTHVDSDDVVFGEVTIRDAQIVGVSSDLHEEEATIRKRFQLTTVGWAPGAKTPAGEPLVPVRCSNATIVLKAEEGGLLPAPEGQELFAPPPVIDFFCDE